MALTRLQPAQNPLWGTSRSHTQLPVDSGYDTRILVQRQWDGWRTTTVRLSDLHDIHWHQPPHAPRPLVHAYVWCSNVSPRDFPHDCVPASAPHRVRVCILKIHTPPTLYAELVRRADDQMMKNAKIAPWTHP
jgi:hypothetical protein